MRDALLSHWPPRARIFAVPALLAVLVGPALAASSTAAPGGTDPHGAVGQDLEPGSNSLTEAQVRERFGKMGFAGVRDLRKDAQGIWHGKAMHAGKELSIRMDHRGNVAAE